MDEYILLKLITAEIAGGLIGLERQFRHGIGLRTLMLVCLGATLFTIYSDNFAFGEGDPRRIAAAVVTGVGFLGAGTIIKTQERVIGLTTAATLWAVASIGVAIGSGFYILGIITTILSFLVLKLTIFERHIKK